MSCTQKGLLRLLIWGHSSGLCLASHLAYSHIWPVSGFFLGQLKGFWEVGRTYYGLASLPFFSPPLELHYPEFLRGQLRTFSAHVRMRKPLDHKRKLWSQGPMLLMASSLKVSTGDCLQQLSLGPVYCLAHIPSQIPGPQGIFIGRMKGKGPPSVASSGWHQAPGPYLTGATEPSSCLAVEPQGDRCWSRKIWLREWLESLHHHHLDMELLPPWRNELNIPDARLLSTGKPQNRSCDGFSRPRGQACISYVSYIGRWVHYYHLGSPRYRDVFCLWSI